MTNSRETKNQLSHWVDEYAGTHIALEQLSSLIGLQREVNRLKDRAIIDARFAGESWAAIAATMGISKQAAHERWG